MPTSKTNEIESVKADLVEDKPVVTLELADALDGAGVTNEAIALTIADGLEATDFKGNPDYKTRAKFIELALEIKKPKKGRERGKFNFIVNIKEKPQKEGFENFIGR